MSVSQAIIFEGFNSDEQVVYVNDGATFGLDGATNELYRSSIGGMQVGRTSSVNIDGADILFMGVGMGSSAQLQDVNIGINLDVSNNSVIDAFDSTFNVLNIRNSQAQLFGSTTVTDSANCFGMSVLDAQGSSVPPSFGCLSTGDWDTFVTGPVVP